MSKETSIAAGFKAGVLALAACLWWAAAHAQTITKCQDEEGNWHYGDFAAEACAESSKITEIDERGVKVREQEAPPTEEELEAEAEERRREQLEAERRKQQRQEENRLLRTYDSAQSIIEARDKRIAALERDLESYRLFRQDLVNEKTRLENNDADAERIEELEQQIQQYDEAIQSVQAERRETTEKFNEDLERYRDITGKDEARADTDE